MSRSVDRAQAAVPAAMGGPSEKYAKRVVGDWTGVIYHSQTKPHKEAQKNELLIVFCVVGTGQGDVRQIRDIGKTQQQQRFANLRMCAID